MPTRRLANLREKSDAVRHFLGEVPQTDTAKLRDLMIDLAEVQAGILDHLEADEAAYEALRPSEEHRR